jgi:hypothetical protein
MAKSRVRKPAIPDTERHSVKVKVLTPVQIPWNSKKGVTLELRKANQLIGWVQITGAAISVRRESKQTWRVYSFEQFMNRLAGPDA